MVELEFERMYAVPRRLVWDAWTDDGFDNGSAKSRATVTFTEVDEGTTMVRVHLIADLTDEVRAGAEQGWGTQLDKLAGFLTSGAK